MVFVRFRKRVIAGGEWGELKEQGTGIKKLFSTNPLTTLKGLALWAWSDSPIPQGKRVWRTCRPSATSGVLPGDLLGCGDSLACEGMQFPMPGGCLAKDMVLDDGTKQDIRKGRWPEAIGRLGVNAAEMAIPTKIPFGRLAGKAGDLFNGTSRFGGEIGDAGKISDALRSARQGLERLRGKHAFGSKLSRADIRYFARKFQSLSPAERTKFLDTLTSDELRDIYNSVTYRSNLRSDLLQSMSRKALKELNPPNPPFSKAFGWTRIDGKLWSGSGPKVDDVRQGLVGDCWCLAPDMALAKLRPSLIKDMIKKNANGTYTVTFRDGRRVTVTDEIPIMGAQVTGEALWPAILEKAIADRMGGYDIMGKGGNPGRAMKWLTGHSPEEFTQSSMPSVKSISDGLSRGDLMTVGFRKKMQLSDFSGAEKRGFETGHAYAVVAADPVKRTVTLENPQIRKVRTITLTQNELRKSQIFLFRTATK